MNVTRTGKRGGRWGKGTLSSQAPGFWEPRAPQGGPSCGSLSRGRLSSPTGAGALVRDQGPHRSPPSPLWFADQWDPAGHGLLQAQPLGQEQPLGPPCGPVARMSRGPAQPAAWGTAMGGPPAWAPPQAERAPVVPHRPPRIRAPGGPGTVSAHRPRGHGPQRGGCTCSGMGPGTQRRVPSRGVKVTETPRVGPSRGGSWGRE